MKKGFTLIELLIVVAIIAILAAIAVPNFLEAQVRAKVARVHSDLRSLATAMESYMVDYNSYTNCDWGQNDRLGGWAQLTTPVGYISTIPVDPFGYSRHVGGAGYMRAIYELGAGRAGIGSAGRPWDIRVGFPSNTWEMNSNGPDKKDDSHNPGNTGRTLGWSDGAYPWEKIDPNDPTAISEVLMLLYDTTNGTRSGGDVFRTGGAKPNGIVFDILFSHSAGK